MYLNKEESVGSARNELLNVGRFEDPDYNSRNELLRNWMVEAIFRLNLNLRKMKSSVYRYREMFFKSLIFGFF